MIIDWDTSCECGHALRLHILDWDIDPDSDCTRCDCPGFEPRKEDDDADR